MKALKPIYRRTKVIIERVLSENRNSADTLVMVGGSTKNSQLIERLRRDYPSFIINNAFPPDESVSIQDTICINSKVNIYIQSFSWNLW